MAKRTKKIIDPLKALGAEILKKSQQAKGEPSDGEPTLGGPIRVVGDTSAAAPLPPVTGSTPAPTPTPTVQNPAQARTQTAARPAVSPAGLECRLALVGAGASGAKMAERFAKVPHVAFTHVVDVDARAGLKLVGEISARQPCRPAFAQDLGAALADGAVSGVVVATADHATADLAVRACAAAKAVFLTGAPGLTIAQGRRIAEASARFGSAVQVRLPHRDQYDAYAAREVLEQGALGRVSLVRVVSPSPPAPDRRAEAFEPGVAVGDAPGAPPRGLDWPAWVGTAAPAVPYSRQRHRDWYSFWDYGGGPLLTHGLPLIDLARMLMGDPPPPRSVSCFGGGDCPEADGYRGGDQRDRDRPAPAERTPRFQSAACDFGVWQMTLESGHGTGAPRIFCGWEWRGPEAAFWHVIPRVEVYGSRATMLFGTNGAGYCVFGVPDGEWRQEVHGAPPQSHHESFFIENIRRQTVPRANVTTAADSAVIAQLANASYRLGGRQISFDGAATDCPEANSMLGVAHPLGGGRASAGAAVTATAAGAVAAAAGEPARRTVAGSADSARRDGDGVDDEDDDDADADADADDDHDVVDAD
jgi:predicted dehydrogenase